MATVKRQGRRHIERIPQNACSCTGNGHGGITRETPVHALGENLSRRRRCSHFGEDHCQRRKSPTHGGASASARWPGKIPHGRDQEDPRRATNVTAGVERDRKAAG